MKVTRGRDLGARARLDLGARTWIACNYLIRCNKVSITPVEIIPERGLRAVQHEGIVRSTARYLLRTEVHTFAFSVAANAILSFFPFILLMMTLIRRVFHSQVMYDVVQILLRDYLPTGQDFVIRNLNALVGTHHRAQIFSLVMLLVTSTG